MTKIIRKHFYTLSFTVICITSVALLYVQQEIRDNVQQVEQAAENQDEIIGDIAEVLRYLDCMTGALLLEDFEERTVEEIIDKCDLSDRRIENIEEVFDE